VRASDILECQVWRSGTFTDHMSTFNSDGMIKIKQSWWYYLRSEPTHGFTAGKEIQKYFLWLCLSSRWPPDIQVCDKFTTVSNKFWGKKTSI